MSMALSAKRCLCLPGISSSPCCRILKSEHALTGPFQVNTTGFRVALFDSQDLNEPRRDAQCRTHHCHKLTACCLETQRHNGTASYRKGHPGNAGNVRPGQANFVGRVPLHKLHHPSSSPALTLQSTFDGLRLHRSQSRSGANLKIGESAF
jgi:hypothetical protein